MLKQRTQLEILLRRALKAAGIVSGDLHKCRRQGCGHVEAASDPAVRRCPKDDRQLWVAAQARPIRFHDLRHTTASLLMMRGANPAAVQRILRHSDPKITTEVYGHLAPGYLRAEVDRLVFGIGAQPAEPQEARQRAVSGSLVTRLLPEASDPLAAPLGGSLIPEGFRATAVERDIGFEPTTFSLGKRKRP